MNRRQFLKQALTFTACILIPASLIKSRPKPTGFIPVGTFKGSDELLSYNIGDVKLTKQMYKNMMHGIQYGTRPADFKAYVKGLV